MTDATPLDAAHAAMEANSQDAAARMRFYERLADSELFLMLKEDVPVGSDNVTPEIFDVGDDKFVLVFDREERLATFSGQQTPYVAISGRNLAAMLVDQGLGMGVNIEVAPSSILLPPQAVTWLAQALGNQPDELEAKIVRVDPPGGLPEELVTAIDTKLATAMGIATAAYIVSVGFDHGGKGHLIAFVDAVPEAQEALATIVSEALTFSTVDAGTIDVSFFRANDAIVDKLERVGLRFDLPQLQETVTQRPSAPGLDPANPPKLK